MKKLFSAIIVTSILFSSYSTSAFDSKSYISAKKEKGSFTLSALGKSASLVFSSKDFTGVLKVGKHLQTDIKNVSDAEPEISIEVIPSAAEIVLIGTIGKNTLIDKLIGDKKISVKEIVGKNEAFITLVVEKPFPKVERALVIVGSDKRGTIYGMYNLSEQIGVSPWYWWADVPVKKVSNIYIKPVRFTLGEPKVKYRGIFLNDEAPALSGWSSEKFGGFKGKFYEKVFELILRLKGNFLWPAMWGSAFYDDDPENPRLADEYGVVISTSHHEPMMRAHDEWRRYGKGPWNYDKNDSTLRAFWKNGIKRMGNYESVVTLAMRGDGDEAMSSNANVSLLEKIVVDQRKILGEVKGKDVTTIPQVWALYKEVQEYYDKGMRVPDDVTLLLCDDNWGNLRKLPKLTDAPRKGGYGIYYHFDYVGGPRNYKWLNTNQIERVWEQMHLAYEYGVKQIWIVNVGDIKPMEFPISFFLDYAWNPEKFPVDKLHEYTQRWAEEQFGQKYSKEIAEILEKYTKYNSRRKPELLSPGTYSLTDYREAEKIVVEYNSLYEHAKNIYDSIAKDYKNAFYQLVLHPVEACSNLNELYVTTGKNRFYASQGRALTNSLAQKVKALYNRDSSITNYYNKILADGKWNHFMDQTHIGYTNWQQPDKNSMPEVKNIELPIAAEMGVSVEGSSKWWPQEKNSAVLQEFDSFNKQNYYIEIFNRGKTAFEFSAQTSASWILLSESKGIIKTEKRLFASIDWKNIPAGKQNAQIKISDDKGIDVTVNITANNPSLPKPTKENYFIENNGYVSINAENYTKKINSNKIEWIQIRNLGRTSSALTSIPVTAVNKISGGNGPHLEYKMYLFNQGDIKVKIYLSPILNFGYTSGLRFGISFDDEEAQIINVNQNDNVPDWKYPNYWNQMVSDNSRIITIPYKIKNAGFHTLKFWNVDPGMVLQKIVVECGEVKPSYLGPPQSFNAALK